MICHCGGAVEPLGHVSTGLVESPPLDSPFSLTVHKKCCSPRPISLHGRTLLLPELLYSVQNQKAKGGTERHLLKLGATSKLK